MKITKLNFEEFMASVERVYLILSNDNSFVEFLDKARMDMPMIDELLEQVVRLKSVSKSRRNKNAITIAIRDLVVMLALYQLEKKKP